MNILILGADGYLGWPTALYFTQKRHKVYLVDDCSKRELELELGVSPIAPIVDFSDRGWLLTNDHPYHIDLASDGAYDILVSILAGREIDTVIHYAEQPSAPYSMRSRNACIATQQRNIIGTLNLMFAVRHVNPDIHIIKLGTMGEYGTPNIDIEEGWLDVEHNGRKDRVLYPKKPGSFYHLSKVADSNNLEFATRCWGLRVTDLNQGIVYGTSTGESKLGTDTGTSFHYDETFGTVLNRFIVQSLLKQDLSVYGVGGQTRGFLDIRDTLRCVEIAANIKAEPGEFRVRNQFTSQWSVNGLASLVTTSIGGKIYHHDNPRVEEEEHYYNAKNDSFLLDGLDPYPLNSVQVANMATNIEPYLDNVNLEWLKPRTLWRQ